MQRRNFSRKTEKHLNLIVRPFRSVQGRQLENSLVRQFASLLFGILLLAGIFCIDPCAAFGQEVASLSTPSCQSVRDWFKEYDQIRTAAEMSLTEKLQTRSFLQKGLRPGAKQPKRIMDLMAKMNSKYATATNAMERLPNLPETKELQDGYTEYFRRMGKLFANGANHDQIDIGTTISLAADRKSIEGLDHQNKTLDASLRKRYKIPKHSLNK